MKEFNAHEKESYLLIKKLIEDNGYKMTYQRREILSQFIINKNNHLSAEKVYDMLKDNGIGISTVYRNINIFVDLDILKEFRVDNKSYYELKMYARKPLHIHLQCEKCGKIKDIVDKEIILNYLKINNLIEKNYNIEIDDVDIMFHGLCNNCTKKYI
ncbi:transcriptional repressor [Anaerosalibacter bizertensis]|uniref:Transcriptional repressor n=2 Tax=Anaerosalibacter bizertensis TaxID=932217 RepID=A0A844FF77_9FIRM|nr:Fur family transcriptional regulator [Anaerosalibacter bizertensis]MBV1816459.1 transcriptional repressor [Bacteroidales bacterium MSK.15.36]HHV26147.1 transcriptional repressor [Tissierellia bacterium]MBU5292516.1 transcriptional repressor [Anaerosalibacter bizertensis]MCB5558518.1 transcriptional repressor [Anaerosalibacter bizertensis]MCG4563848.1 transcriptional repressor [Anaerosalibacter bizertensis]